MTFKNTPIFLSLGLIASGLLASCGEAPKASMEPEKSKHPWDWVPEDATLAAGRELYLNECSLCHNEGEEGAPALTKKAEWAERISQGEAKLVEKAISGFIGPDGEMPARGGSGYLTDDEMASMVKYMMAATQR